MELRFKVPFLALVVFAVGGAGGIMHNEAIHPQDIRLLREAIGDDSLYNIMTVVSDNSNNKAYPSDRNDSNLF